ncbi:hypothetical protein WA026_013569 [Henosepilachna vigintioctopunctata]|uniref:Uncharacterized protein n=1 Tax=Henosepilachna vigintioctopunctata TaxID=420089 RepID=A0AAW1VF54_9CUCU
MERSLLNNEESLFIKGQIVGENSVISSKEGIYPNAVKIERSEDFNTSDDNISIKEEMLDDDNCEIWDKKEHVTSCSSSAFEMEKILCLNGNESILFIKDEIIDENCKIESEEECSKPGYSDSIKFETSEDLNTNEDHIVGENGKI